MSQPHPRKLLLTAFTSNNDFVLKCLSLNLEGMTLNWLCKFCWLHAFVHCLWYEVPCVKCLQFPNWRCSSADCGHSAKNAKVLFTKMCCVQGVPMSFSATSGSLNIQISSKLMMMSLCDSRDCPIFYRRKKAQKDMAEAKMQLDRWNFWAHWVGYGNSFCPVWNQCYL